MNEHVEPHPEPPSQADAAPAEAGQPPASRAEGAGPSADAPAPLGAADEPETPPAVEAARLHLIPYRAAAEADADGSGARSAGRWSGRWAAGFAASLALISAVAAAGLYDHASQSRLLTVKAEESQGLAQTVKALKDRIEAIEAARARDESADLRKVAGEIKAESAAARDLGAALAQLTQRVDRVDHDHGARLDKLADRFDHETAPRIADLATRLDKLEKKQVAAAVSPEPGVSYEPTGSIAKPQPPLRGYWIVDVEDGMAIIDGRDGPRQVTPGDFLPGAGRVQRIERRGQGWVVVTSAGLIVAGSPF